MIKILVLLNNEVVISLIEEVPSELGEPDCRIIDPFIIKEPQIAGTNHTLEPWLSGYTKQNIFMIHSDKILTITDPTARLKELYEDLTK
jgi:hypothetical protein